MGNGAKAQQKRERNQKDSKAAKSQLKVNEKAVSIQCNVCKATFLQTTKTPALLEHASNKHNKDRKCVALGGSGRGAVEFDEE